MIILAILAAAPAPLVLTKVVPAPPAVVFTAFTTKSGLERFLAPQLNVSLTKDGPFEAFFVPELPAGQRGSEGCVVKDWVEGKSFTFTWNFPPSIPALRNAKARTEVQVTFEPQGSSTLVTLTQSGWKDGADWVKGRAYFERAWGIVLARLERVFLARPIDWKHAWRPVQVKELAFLQGAWRSKPPDIAEEVWLVDGASGGMWARERTDAKADFTEVGELEQSGNEVFLTVRMLGPALDDHPKGKARFVLEELEDDVARFVEVGTPGGLVLTYRRSKNALSIELAGAKSTQTLLLEKVP